VASQAKKGEATPIQKHYGSCRGVASPLLLDIA
jgi:hypothetical protein